MRHLLLVLLLLLPQRVLAAYVIPESVQETTTTTGTGTYDLAGAATGYLAFASQLSSSDTVPYAVYDGAGGFESGIGTWTDASPDTLARTTILYSTNAGAAVDWGAGTKTVISAPLGKLTRSAVSGNVADCTAVTGLVAPGLCVETDGDAYWCPGAPGTSCDASWIAVRAGAVEGTDLGTLTDGNLCRYDLAGTEIDCNLAQNAGTDITADLEEEAHCSEHDSADLDCSGETLLVADDALDFTELKDSLTLDANTALAFGAYGLTLDITNPSSPAFDLNGTGAFADDLLHIHQHTGNPTGGNLLHAEASDADVTPLLHIEALAPSATGTADAIVGLLIDTDDVGDTSFRPILVQDNNEATPNTLFAVNYQGIITTTSVGDTSIVAGAVDGGSGGEIADGSVTADDLATDSVSADELNATGVESELESTLDIGGDVSSTGMASTTLGADVVADAELDLIDGNSATDEYCLTYESGGSNGNLEWQTCGGGISTFTECTRINPLSTQTSYIWFRVPSAFTATGWYCETDQSSTTAAISLGGTIATTGSTTCDYGGETGGSFSDSAGAADTNITITRGTVVGAPYQVMVCVTYSRP